MLSKFRLEASWRNATRRMKNISVRVSPKKRASQPDFLDFFTRNVASWLTCNVPFAAQSAAPMQRQLCCWLAGVTISNLARLAFLQRIVPYDLWLLRHRMARLRNCNHFWKHDKKSERKYQRQHKYVFEDRSFPFKDQRLNSQYSQNVAKWPEILICHMGQMSITCSLRATISVFAINLWFFTGGSKEPPVWSTINFERWV